jgi:hypothetical protein
MKIKCKCCGVVLDSKYGFSSCACRKIYIDDIEGTDSVRIGGDEGDYEYVE